MMQHGTLVACAQRENLFCCLGHGVGQRWQPKEGKGKGRVIFQQII
jgi:hypothetical protein